MNRAAPKFEQKIYPGHKIAALVGVMAENGVSPAQVLSGTGIAVDQLSLARVSYRQMLTVFENARRLSPSDPSVPFRAGQRMHVTSFGMLGYAKLSSPNHGASLEFGIKHQRINGPLIEVRVHEEAGIGVGTYEPIPGIELSDELFRFLTEFCLTSHMTLTTDLCGPSFRYLELRIGYAAPGHAHLYEAAFDCPVHFGHARSETRYDLSWLRKPVTFADPITNAMTRQVCEQALLEVIQDESVAAEVRRSLIKLPGQFPGVHQMADSLAMSPRSLRRKLSAERTTYSKILSDVRVHLAVEYLRKTTMTNEEIASRLGYSDAANFRHAFTRWTRKHPSDFRAK
ncbi:AraC family transcriptional regulator [soil metagenome]